MSELEALRRELDEAKGDIHRLWVFINTLDKTIAVSCHEIKDVKADITVLYQKAGILQGKHDDLIKEKLELVDKGKDRKNRIVVAFISGVTAGIAILIDYFLSHSNR